jgi:hypothetical protein
LSFALPSFTSTGWYSNNNRSGRHDTDESQDKWWLCFQVDVARIEKIYSGPRHSDSEF